MELIQTESVDKTKKDTNQLFEGMLFSVEKNINPNHSIITSNMCLHFRVIIMSFDF